jgi:hypothetical protein
MSQESRPSRPTSRSDDSGLGANDAASPRVSDSSGGTPQPPQHAWAISSGWCGPPELLARIAAAAIEALRELENSQTRCAVDVTVPVDRRGRRFGRHAFDVEKFDSPESFTERVTDDALRKFVRIDITVLGREASVRIIIVRERGFKLRRIVQTFVVRRWPPDEGVFLDVTSRDPNAYGVGDVRDRVLAAIERGHSDWRHVMSSSGERTPFGTASAFRRKDDPREALLTRGMFGVLILFAILAQLGWTSTDRAFFQWGSAVAFGVVLSAVAFLLLPVIEVSASTRIGQAGRAALRVALLAAGPAVGLLLNHFVKPHI